MLAGTERSQAWGRAQDGRTGIVTAALLGLIVTGYAVLGLRILDPNTVYSGDIGVKFVQARALAASRFTSLDIPYPGQFIDRGRELFPIRPPFVMVTAGSTQAIFSPTSAIVQAAAVALGGMRGMTLVSLAAGAVILMAAALLAEPGQASAVLLALGLAGPLWFYAVSGWEHAPAVALSTAAFACAVRLPLRIAPLLAGICLGAGATIRDEVLLLAPGLALLVWLRARTAGAVFRLMAGVLVPLAFAAAVEVWWFGRPVAAHLRHAVHLLQSAAGVAHGSNPDVPALRPFTMRERYDTVVVYWLLGFGRDPWVIGYGMGLAAAIGIRVWLRSSIGLLAWLAAVIVPAAIDLHELVTAPKWLAGLHRVSPYLVLAMFPMPLAGRHRGWFVPVTLVTVVVYLALAFAGADTSGGKALGPRLLLPLMPLLTAAAISTIAAYLRAPGRVDRLIGRGGLLLVLMSMGMHLFGTIPAYVQRNHGDSEAVEAVASSPERVVVVDDVFTAQLLFPLYYRKIVFLADSPALAGRLLELFESQRVSSAVVVSRQVQPAISLAPFRVDRTEQHGRMVLQYSRK